MTNSTIYIHVHVVLIRRGFLPFFKYSLNFLWYLLLPTLQMEHYFCQKYFSVCIYNGHVYMGSSMDMHKLDHLHCACTYIMNYKEMIFGWLTCRLMCGTPTHHPKYISRIWLNGKNKLVEISPTHHSKWHLLHTFV